MYTLWIHRHANANNNTKMKQKQNLITFAAATEPQMRHCHISFIGNAKQVELLAMSLQPQMSVPIPSAHSPCLR